VANAVGAVASTPRRGHARRMNVLPITAARDGQEVRRLWSDKQAREM
jgi:hypothetical protein